MASALKKLKRAKSICWINDNELIFYRKNAFFSWIVNTDKIMPITFIKLSLKLRFLSMFSLFRRLLRLYPHSPAYDSKSNILYFSMHGHLYSLNLSNQELVVEHELNHNASRILSICVCQNGRTFYGEYPTKNDGMPICIYEKVDNNKWINVYSFNANEIRHIHLLKEYRGDLYCFTGDEDYQTKILCFKKMRFEERPITLLSNSQEYRTCVVAFSNHCFFYTTDSPYCRNKLYKFDLSNKRLEALFLLEGSVIYGLESHDKLFFSTVVENNLTKDKNDKNVIIRIDGIKGGIQSKSSFVYSFDFRTKELMKIISKKKDIFPKGLLGLGTFTFTCNHSKKYLAVTSSSLVNNETTYIIKL